MRRFALALCVVMACAGDDDGGPLTVDDLPGAASSAYCGALVRCGVISDIATCRRLDLGLDFDFDPEISAAVHNGTVIFNEQEARLCIAGFGSTSCGDAGFDSNEHCDLAFEGTIAAGGTCQISEQCISQQCSIPACPDQCCPGTCYGDTPPMRPRVGESCLSGGCVDSYCDNITYICTAFKGTGEPCTSDTECVQGYCTGVCTSFPGEGSPCPGNESSCGSLGLYCSPSTMTCTAWKLDGDPCDSNSLCSPAYECVAGGCKLKPTLGDTCEPQTRDCIDASFCDPATLRCTAPLPDGAACDDNIRCAGHCDFQTLKCASEPICI